ncbi:MAG: hypothetical protein ACOYD0_03495 [Candidatus Nanopelagicales bacterium]
MPTAHGRLRVTSEFTAGVSLDGVDERMRVWLVQLDGSRQWSHQLAQASAMGIDVRTAEALLQRLFELDLLCDVATAAQPDAGPPVTVFGCGPPADAVVALLGQTSPAIPVPRPNRAGDELAPDWSQLAPLSEALIENSRWAVLVLDRATADGIEVGFSERLTRAGVRHQVVGTGEVGARVGPLVLPGRTPCLRCEQLAERDWDPDWLAIGRHQALDGKADGLADPVLTWLVAAEAIRQLRAVMVAESPRVRDSRRWSSIGGVLGVCEGGDAWTRRPLSRHRACGCWWSELAFAEQSAGTTV